MASHKDLNRRRTRTEYKTLMYLYINYLHAIYTLIYIYTYTCYKNAISSSIGSYSRLFKQFCNSYLHDIGCI